MIASLRVFVHGFPGLYGGAGTELHHQIIAWRDLGQEVHIIPSGNADSEPLFGEMVRLGVTVHAPNDFSILSAEDAILGFCNAEFLNALPEIRKYTHRTIFVNCMTWIFDSERAAMENGLLAGFLYQNREVMEAHSVELQKLNSDSSILFEQFVPYFSDKDFPYISERSSEVFGCGRISRQDADKYSKNTLHIYEYFVSPKWKRGLFLGFDHRSEEKIGKPFDWITTASDHHTVSQQQFYKHCEIVLQPTDTTENWPRVGLEAMASGSVLIVDNRGGWRQMVKHGETGWLCDHERDFIYYASKMAYEPRLRDELANNALERVEMISGLERSKESWDRVFRKIALLPT